MTTIALISSGSLGTAVGMALAAGGHRICCSVEGRSASTRDRAAAAGFDLCESLDGMLAESDVVLSLATPSSALSVCADVAASLERLHESGQCKDKKIIYVDGNSISPLTSEKIREIACKSHMVCVKASFFGPSNRLSRDNVVLLSGKGGEEVAALFDHCAEVRWLGEEFSAASAVKMCMSILTKNLPAIFLESMQAALRSGQIESTLWLADRLYPEISAMMARMLPTYPAHFSRRVDEMLEIEQWAEAAAQGTPVTRVARESIEQLKLSRYEGIHFDNFLEMLDAFLLGAAPASVAATQRQAS